MSKKKDIPKFANDLIETHCHLDYLKELSTEEILKKCEDHNIKKIVTIAVDSGNLESVRNLASSFDQVFGTQGIHPHHANEYSETVEKEIRNHINDKHIVAVGEIGLDFYYNNSKKEEQIPAFEKQLQIAVDTNKPVVIHTREADEDTIAILKNFSKTLKGNGVIHSFTSSVSLAEFCLDEGFYLGFNGIITFKNAQNVRDVLAVTPIEQTLIETDSPFLTPVPFRGRENAPFYLPFVAEKIASEKEMNIEDVLKITKNNAINLFKL